LRKWHLIGAGLVGVSAVGVISFGAFVVGTIVGAVAIAVAGVAYVAAGAFFFGIFGPCADEVLTVARSPDGVHVATVIERNCGATTPYVLAVELHEYGDGLPSDLGTDAVYLAEGRGMVVLRWDDATHLFVGLARVQGPPFRKSPAWRNIAITYSYGE
jgi:hypothetical protein